MKNGNIIGTMNICRWGSGPCPDAGFRTRDGVEFTVSIAVVELRRHGSPCEVALRLNGRLDSQFRVIGLSDAKLAQWSILNDWVRYAEKRGGKVKAALA